MKEAQELLNQIARVNGKEEENEPLQEFNSEENKQRLGDFRDLFANRRMTHLTLLSWYAW